MPAYPSFLAEQGVDPGEVRTFADFQRVPPVTKANYLLRHPLSQLCRGGRLWACDMIAVSSGSTGKPAFWPRSVPDELGIATRFEQVFRDSFGAHERRTLAVVCFALGTWVGGMFTASCCRHLAAKGYPVTVITPGNNKEEIFRVVEELGPAFEQVVLLGYPPFLKDVVDAGIARGVPWPRLGVRLVTAGEVFSEEWRTLMAERIGSSSPVYDFASLYGTADAGVLGNETPLSIAARRFLASRPEAARAVFGQDRLPTLVQYDPMSRFFEAAGGQLLFTGDNGVPLVRYGILDTGGIVPYEEMLVTLAGFGFDPAPLLPRGVARPLPFAYVFGRSDFTVSFYGAKRLPRERDRGPRAARRLRLGHRQVRHGGGPRPRPGRDPLHRRRARARRARLRGPAAGRGALHRGAPLPAQQRVPELRARRPPLSPGDAGARGGSGLVPRRGQAPLYTSPLMSNDALAALRAAILVHGRSPLGRELSPRGLGPYRGYGEMLGALERLVMRGARLEQIGRSVRGEPLFAVHLGSEKSGARTSVALSAVHPHRVDRRRGVPGAPRSPRPRRPRRPRRHRRAHRQPPTASSGSSSTCAPGAARFVRHNARGVDLNRNFDASWGRRGLVQRLLSFLFSPGAAPASEPEVAAIAHHLASRRVDRAVSLHSFGGVVLYPPAASRRPVLDAAEHRAWARRIAAGAASRPYRAIPCSWWSLGVTSAGLEIDWFHQRHGALSLLVECSRGGFGLRPSRLFQPFAWFNPPAIQEVAAPLVEALVPYVRGAAV